MIQFNEYYINVITNYTSTTRIIKYTSPYTIDFVKTNPKLINTANWALQFNLNILYIFRLLNIILDTLLRLPTPETTNRNNTSNELIDIKFNLVEVQHINC